MKRINHFMLPEHTNSLHKNEAISSISLTKEVAEKINELVDELNKLSKEDLAWKQNQEGIIRKGVIYMKDNLINSLNDLMETLKNSGFIDSRIEEQTAMLNSRLTTLLNSVAPGTTTLDAELIDIRTGYNQRRYASAGDSVREQIKLALHNVATINASNYQTLLPDVDAAESNSIYALNFAKDVELPLNLPWQTNLAENTLMYLITIDGASSYGYQLLLTMGGELYGRIKADNWLFWLDLTKKNEIAEITKKINGSLKQMETLTAANYQAILPDVSKAEENSIYCINFASFTELPDGLPWKQNPEGKALMYLLTFDNAASYGMQMLFSYDNTLYIRYKAGSWGNWLDLSPRTTSGASEVITVGASGDYKKLTDALKYANAHMNVTIKVDAGTYDIIEELGDDYFANYQSGYTDLYDMCLQNGVTLIFSPNSKVVCHYTGSNQNVRQYFCPFNSLAGHEGDFTIDGLVLEVSGCRYAIHDDISGSKVQQKHIYKNCEITCDTRSIGAGFGSNEVVEIIDCIFHTTTTSASVSWHNGITDGVNKLVMNGCYFDGAENTLRLSHYGDYETKSKCVVTNNNFKKAIILEMENGGTKENIQLIEWNNKIG